MGLELVVGAGTDFMPKQSVGVRGVSPASCLSQRPCCMRRSAKAGSEVSQQDVVLLSQCLAPSRLG
jgi:hypothetical protein